MKTKSAQAAPFWSSSKKVVGLLSISAVLFCSADILLAEKAHARIKHNPSRTDITFSSDHLSHNDYAIDSIVIVKGIIYDSDNKPLASASVVDKSDRQRGTVTGSDGKFEISVAINSTLQISHINHLSKDVIISGNVSNLEIQLEQGTQQLEEIVVVGFGTTSIRKNTTAVASFNAENVKELPFGDMGSALQGRVAGVIVQQGSAEPGQNGASISIRGNGTPLYVIDGFISTSARFLTLNKTDIKSMTILKDAASTAVYGMNAANGVIVVTTKQGETGKLSVDYQANFAFNTPSYPTRRMNAYQFATAVNNLNQALGQGTYSFRSLGELNEIAQNLDQYTNWEKSLLRDYAPQKEQTISLSGGTERLRFFGSLNALDQQGIYKGNSLEYNRYNYRSNVSSSFDKIGLTLDFNVNGSLLKEKYPPAGAGVIYSRLRDRNPFEKPFTSTGQVSNQFDNPALQLQSPGYIKLNTVYNQLAGALKWKIPGVDGLSLGFNGNYNVESQDRVDWVQTATYYDEDGNETKEDPANIGISRSSFMTSQYDLNFRADYSRTFKEKHNIEATLVHTRQHYYTNSLTAGSRGFNTTEIHQIQKGDASTITASNGEGMQAWMGYVGRFHYDYGRRYMVEFAGRYDGSDNFGKDSRWGFFPSVSGGWTISEENFFSPIKRGKVLNYLKLRASYGEIGLNDVDHWKYAYLPTYDYNSNAYVVDGKLVNTVTPGPTPSANMTWYTRTKYDVGLDFFLFNNKIEGSVDWFFEKTKGFLSADKFRYTGPIGYELPLVVSEAEDRIEGFDGGLKYKTKIGQVDFTTGFNFTYYKSIAFKTNEDSLTLINPRIRQQGNEKYYVGTGYVGAEFYTNPEQILNNPKRITSRDLRPGDLQYRDVNGDGKIDGQDQSRYGHNASPNFVFGFDIGVRYQGVNVMATVQGTGPRQTYMSNIAMGSEGERRLDFEFQNDKWTPENLNAIFPRAGNASLNDNNNYASSDFWARKSNYVRLKSLTVSYDFKYAALTRQEWLRNLSVYVSGVNLFAVGPSVKYGDPEANNFDGYSYPMMKTYSFGFQLGF
ncbi:SusC/RagA family TonB-linked outer membrane protein [Sphingobacterium faecium]|uniref:SusC/RagA family TonB-linked outer membrane protein n=1 Tax=Sphingobacterium faecium TaxID=34087 RepID=UPI0012916675|nr:SusC/RagA family TonB-linked outer membrane protein [Sphingobacterium faecium]MQP27855.1 SusC/RagA family TonB-linked outer membrane protein [Sphingobacterium faecium]